MKSITLEVKALPDGGWVVRLKVGRKVVHRWKAGTATQVRVALDMAVKARKRIQHTTK